MIQKIKGAQTRKGVPPKNDSPQKQTKIKPIACPTAGQVTTARRCIVCSSAVDKPHTSILRAVLRRTSGAGAANAAQFALPRNAPRYSRRICRWSVALRRSRPPRRNVDMVMRTIEQQQAMAYRRLFPEASARLRSWSSSGP
jgi:hypothetical protein